MPTETQLAAIRARTPEGKAPSPRHAARYDLLDRRSILSNECAAHVEAFAERCSPEFRAAAKANEAHRKIGARPVIARKPLFIEQLTGIRIEK